MLISHTSIVETASYKKPPQSFASSVKAQKVESAANKALYDLVAFNDAVTENIAQLEGQYEAGHPIDHKLLVKLMDIQAQYQVLMDNLKHYDDETDNLAIVIYADTVQDLVKYLNKKS